jgi:hypothetical protein
MTKQIPLVADRVIIADARTTSPIDFLRELLGESPQSQAEKDEADARAARIRTADLIHKAEYAIARRQREALIWDRIINGSQGLSDEEWHTRLNEPFCKAADRVNARLAELERRRAA